ncbi:MAG: tRNA (adenosine(37)-N6)-threonylcarbamoyltransferase complex dimerization subunit type 1 TsaB [Rhodospirillaceae bacterium]
MNQAHRIKQIPLSPSSQAGNLSESGVKVLAIDTAAAACSVAIWRSTAPLVSRFEVMERGHAERLVPMIAEVLDEAGLTAAALDRLAVTVGPGAFTGLRVGLATARGLALAIGRPLLGLTTFEVIGHGLAPELRAGRSVLVAVESRRSEVFLQRFTADLVAEGPPTLLTAEGCRAWLPAGPLLVAGCGAAALREILGDRLDTVFVAGPGLPDAAVAARLAAGLDVGAGLPPRPLYLRPPDAMTVAQRAAQ